MAMNKATMKSVIKADLDTKGFDVNNQFTKIGELVDSIIDGMIDHIIANAETKSQIGTTVTMPIGSIITVGSPTTQSNTPASIGSGSETDAPGTIS